MEADRQPIRLNLDDLEWMTDLLTDGFPAYLETQNSGNLELYRRLGFNVSAEGEFPKLAGLNNWGMLRPSAAG